MFPSSFWCNTYLKYGSVICFCFWISWKYLLICVKGCDRNHLSAGSLPRWPEPPGWTRLKPRAWNWYVMWCQGPKFFSHFLLSSQAQWQESVVKWDSWNFSLLTWDVSFTSISFKQLLNSLYHNALPTVLGIDSYNFKTSIGFFVFVTTMSPG